MRIVFLLLVIPFLTAYEDEELKCLWEQVSDIYHPRLEDFQLIQDYIMYGKRPYLDPLRDMAKNETQKMRVNRICDFQLIGPNNEMPVFEIHRLNEHEQTNHRCVLIFASYNERDLPYPEYARNIIKELSLVGYSGHVLMRIGGFPNLSQGSLKYCYVPYAFKVAFFQEARSLGYKEILWVDCAMHPLRDLENIFFKIKNTGCFFISPGPSDSTYFLKVECSPQK